MILTLRLKVSRVASEQMGHKFERGGWPKPSLAVVLHLFFHFSPTIALNPRDFLGQLLGTQFSRRPYVEAKENSLASSACRIYIPRHHMIALTSECQT
jgi:hypothetical protein